MIVLKNKLKYPQIIFVLILSYILFISLFSRTGADVDLWGYLAFGRVFWESGYFPYQDIFSYMPTKALWVYHEWLTGVIFYPVLKYSGSPGVQLLRYIMIVITAYFVYAAAIKKGATPQTAFIALLPSIFLVSFGYTTVARAQIFTYLFFALTLFIIEKARNDEKWTVLLWLVPIQFLWCNLHGGFVAGLGLIGLYALGDALSGKKFLPFVMVLFPAAMVTLINPYGLEYWKFIIHATLMPRPEIDEWMSVLAAFKTNYHLVAVTAFIVLSAICLILFALRAKKNSTELLILVAMSYLGYSHARHVIFLGLLFGAFVPVVLSRHQNSWIKKFPIFFPWLAPVLLAILFVCSQTFIHRSAAISVLPSFAVNASGNYYPLAALNWMKKNSISGNILPFFGWGEFLIWSYYPNCKVAMDGRYETVYPEVIHRQYFDFLTGRKDWQIFLNEYSHDLVLIKPNSKINALMLQQPTWVNIYSDTTSSLFLRKTKRD